MEATRQIIVAITGASGALYAKRLLEVLAATERLQVHLVVSPLGRRLLHDELGIEALDEAGVAGLAGTAGAPANVTVLPYKDVGATIASGSFPTEAMVVIPCSSNKLAELAHGLGDNLISRAAQVILKERRRLIVVHREMPLGLIELRNMVALTEAGAIVCPANPGFYHHPQSVDDLINFVVGRVLDLLQVPHALTPRWTGTMPLVGPAGEE